MINSKIFQFYFVELFFVNKTCFLKLNKISSLLIELLNMIDTNVTTNINMVNATHTRMMWI